MAGFQIDEQPCERTRADAAIVAGESAFVTVSEAAAEQLAPQLAEELASGRFSLEQWRQHPLHPSSDDETNAEWVFLIDLLNYSFYSDPEAPAFTVRYKEINYTGYWSLCAAVNRALDEGVNLLDAQVRARLTTGQFETIFRSETATPAPMLTIRHKHVLEASQTLLDRFDGRFSNVIKLANGSAQELVRLVLEHFPTFRDISPWKGKQVYILKRVQILVADLWGCFQGRGLGYFEDIDKLTMFADYRVPQSLAYFGLLKYSSELMSMLKADTCFRHDDPREIAIRACSIHAVEVLLKHVAAELERRNVTTPVNAVILDFYLWDLAKAEAAKMADIPIHRTRCFYY